MNFTQHILRSVVDYYPLTHFLKRRQLMNVMSFKAKGRSVVWLLPLLFYVSDAAAVNATQLITPVTNFITGSIINNVGTIAVLAAAVVGIIMALGQQIGKFVLNNLGYVGYVAFGSAMATGALTAAGMTI